MIKLERGECPKELHDSVKEELTKLYKEDNIYILRGCRTIKN